VRATAAPALRRAGASLDTVVDLDPLLAELTREACGFARAATDWRAAVRRLDSGLVVVASYHASHAEIASFALRDGKAVLVEKPPAVTADDLEELADAASLPGAFLEVGYNRRFAPLAREAKALFDEAGGPAALTFLVQELRLPARHWYRWPGQGTRVTGNLCHWIDLAAYFLGPECAPARMTLAGHDECQTLTIEFEDDSVATVVATSHGDATLGVQETIRVRRGDLTIAIDDFRSLEATRSGRTLRRLGGRRDKGHRAMYRETVERVRAGLPARYGVDELRLTTSMVIRAAELALGFDHRGRGGTRR
jgi:predicted dehydrogenase